MNRSVLALAAVVVAVAVPSAAQATTFDGSCQLNGTYAIDEDSYEFEGAADGGTCSGTLNGERGGFEVVYESSGAASGSCLATFLDGTTGQLDFYRVDILTQQQTFVDRLELSGGAGIATTGAFRRAVGGAAGGAASESGTLRGGLCGGGRFSSVLETLSGDTLRD